VLTSNQRHKDVIADLLSHDPDVVAVAELSSSLAEKLQSELAATHPYSLLRPQDLGNFGIGLLSKSPLRASEVFYAGETEIESIAATVSINGNDYRVYATHPLPPMGAKGFASRNQHLQGIAQCVQDFQAANAGTSIVLVGDLNLTPWSPLFGKFEQESGLRRAGVRFDLHPTWYRFNSFPFGLMLDHGLISPDLKCVGIP
jgi:endonuclease/exonuclease/phosphatase (EEP) superfamily protein YafD